MLGLRGLYSISISVPGGLKDKPIMNVGLVRSVSEDSLESGKLRP